MSAIPKRWFTLKNVHDEFCGNVDPNIFLVCNANRDFFSVVTYNETW